jgi:hypothetical protein
MTVPLDNGPRQGVAKAKKVDPAAVVLEAAQSRLAGQIIATGGVATQQEFLHRVVADPRNIIGVAVAAAKTEHALPDDVGQRMPDLGRLTWIDQTPGHRSCQAEFVVDGFQQKSAAVAGGVWSVESDVDRLGKEFWKKDRLFAKIRHQKAFLFDFNLF